MAGTNTLNDMAGVMTDDLYNQLFASKDYTGVGDGYGPNNSRWYDQVSLGGDGGLTNGNQTSGFSGSWFNPTTYAVNENGDFGRGSIKPEAISAFDNYNFDYSPEAGGDGGTLRAFDPSGKLYGTYKQPGSDWIDQAAGMLIPAFVTGGFGTALGGAFGGGLLGNAAGHGLAGGISSSMQGGKFGEGLLSGIIGGGLQGLGQGTPAVMGNNPSAYIPAQPGTTLSGLAGISNPTLAGMFNRGAGAALGSLATGHTGSEALKSGLTGGALAGINSLGAKSMDFIGNAFRGLSAPEEEAYSSNPAANASYPAGGYMPNGSMALQQAGIGPEMSYAPPGSAGDTNGEFLNSVLAPTPSFSAPQKQSVGLDSGGSVGGFGDLGKTVGNFVTNNVGDLASMLYGFYNNRKQQSALNSQLAGLKGLYSNNSPYATQLRNQLNAQAAAKGHRTNIAGRETQLQAMLADRAASMMLAQFQIQQGQNALKNNNMNMLLQGFNKLGGFNAVGQGLQSLFRPSPSLTGPGSYNAYQNMDDMYGTVG